MYVHVLHRLCVRAASRGGWEIDDASSLKQICSGLLTWSLDGFARGPPSPLSRRHTGRPLSAGAGLQIEAPWTRCRDANGTAVELGATTEEKKNIFLLSFFFVVPCACSASKIITTDIHREAAATSMRVTGGCTATRRRRRRKTAVVADRADQSLIARRSHATWRSSSTKLCCVDVETTSERQASGPGDDERI